MKPQNHPTSTLRLHSTIRIALLLGLIGAAATVLSVPSLASSIGQRLFAGAATIIGRTSTPDTHSASVEFAAPVESASMATERHGHTATRLADGRVLIAGGENTSGTLNQTEFYDPAAATFSDGGNMTSGRVDHSATLLADGRVLIAGGRNGGTALATTEIFDPASGSFTSGPTMSVARAGHSATLLANGRVLIAGGDASGSAEIYDPATGEFAATGDLSVARSQHSAALLQNGSVLVVGGHDGAGTSGEIFDASAGTFSAVNNELKVARAQAHLRVLFDGKVQIIGGSDDGSMEVYDPALGFGAYAHVLPESDPCTGLSGQIVSSQTRAALFHNGQADALLDRTGHTITELDGQALVLGGVNSSGAVLSSSAVLASSSAAITTDKLDYAPGETAHISGRGFQPGEVVRLKIHEDPHTPQERGFDVTADADGNFSGDYLVMDYDLNMRFIAGARGLSSGRTAQTTLTDARNLILTFAGTGSGQVTVTPSTGTVNAPVSCGGSGTAQASQTVSTTCLPNITTSDNGATVTFNAVANPGSTFAGWSGQAGLSPSTCTGTTNPCSAVLGGGPTLTVTFNNATVNTTTTVANANATYGDTSVTLNATVTPASGPAVNNGSVTFTVKQGPTTIGVATTDNTVVAGAASVSYALPAGTNAGPYTIQASYTPGSGFNASSGTGTLTINKRAIEVTADAGQFKTYGDADPAAFTYSITSGSLAFTDSFTGALSRVAGEDAGLYAITIGTLAINDGNGGNNYTLTFVSKNFEIKKRNATWTTNPNSKTYGDPDPTPLTTGSGSNFLAADNVTATYTRAAGENASLPTYHITATLSATPAVKLNNYIITNNGAEFTINKRAVQVTADAGQFKTYGDADPTFTYSITSGSLAFTDSFTGALSRVAGEDAGLYAITIGTLAINDGNGGNNYNLTFVSKNFEIKKRTATWTINPNSKTYGDPDPTPLTTGSGSNFLAADNVTATYTRATGENASGPTYHITATLSATPAAKLNNYIITNNGAEFTINKRAVQVTADAGQFKTYGDADPAAFTYSITSGSLAFTDSFTGALSRVAGEDAGLYAITIGTLAISDGNGGNNYNLTFVSKNFEIKKRNATWTTNPNSKTYGDPDPTPLTTGSGSNFLPADGVTAIYSRVAGENASPPTYHITATLSATPAAKLNNYIITNNGAEFTINKRAVEVTADAGQFKTYGDADPAAFTYSITSGSLAFSDSFTGALSRVAGEDAGLYAITIGTLAINDGNGGNNYTLTFVSKNFEIKKRNATWTTNPNSKTYGDPDPTPLTTGSGSNFLPADGATATYTRAAGENASGPTYHITATLSATPAAKLNNYIITNNGAEFTINKRAVEVTADAGQFKTYGDADPAAFTYSITSGSLAFTDSFTGALSRVAGEDAGLYAITIGTLAINDGNSGNNYTLTFVSNNFEIKKRAATWTTDPNSKTYGDPDPSPLTTGSGSNFLAADNVTATYTRAAGENASGPTYHITATLSATPAAKLNNYIITNNGAEFTINKRAVEVTADAGQFKIYGDADPAAFTYSITSGSLAFTDTFTGALSRVAGEDAGLYAITIGTLTINDGNGGNNYNLTFVSNNFEIKKRNATWITNPNSKTYGDPDPTPLTTGSGSNFLPADGVTATYSRVAGENAAPPTYHISATLNATPVARLNNYIITNNGAEFTINKRSLQVTATAGQSKIYGNADPTFAYTITSGTLAFSDTFTGALSRVAGENVGLYAITIGTLKVNDGNGGNNYNLTLVSNNFEIKKRAIAVKADAKTKTFGDPDPVFTYQITSGSLAFSDAFTGALTRDAGELVGSYAIKIGTLAINDGNGGNNYTLTFTGNNLTILTACSVFNGFLEPVGGSVELGTGGSFANPVRSFKLNSTIPVKFNAICFGVPLTTGIHTLQAIKYSSSTTSDPAIDATPTDAATTGNQFRLTDGDWHFNLSTKGLGANGQGTWLLQATLFDGSTHTVWVSIKK